MTQVSIPERQVKGHHKLHGGAQAHGDLQALATRGRSQDLRFCSLKSPS